MKLDDAEASRIATTNDERADLVRLRRESRVAKMEMEILKWASAYFGTATDAVDSLPARLRPRWKD
jgi:transposase-like protein